MPTLVSARCRACGATLAEDQEWCLECGTARTLVARPPNPWIAAAVIAGVVALALALALIAIGL